MALFRSVDSAKTPTFSFSVLQQRMFTPRTRFSQASSLGFHCVPFNRIYGITKTPCATISPFTVILNMVTGEKPDVRSRT